MPELYMNPAAGNENEDSLANDWVEDRSKSSLADHPHCAEVAVGGTKGVPNVGSGGQATRRSLVANDSELLYFSPIQGPSAHTGIRASPLCAVGLVPCNKHTERLMTGPMRNMSAAYLLPLPLIDITLTLMTQGCSKGNGDYGTYATLLLVYMLGRTSSERPIPLSACTHGVESFCQLMPQVPESRGFSKCAFTAHGDTYSSGYTTMLPFVVVVVGNPQVVRILSARRVHVVLLCVVQVFWSLSGVAQRTKFLRMVVAPFAFCGVSLIISQLGLYACLVVVSGNSPDKHG
eukprot:677637-Amphidinium_carterae.2